jgi:hypothetical protein
LISLLERLPRTLERPIEPADTMAAELIALPGCT